MTDVYAPPAFQLYARDWITNTAQLTAEEKGALADLKAYAWLAAMRGEPPCSLPDDDAKLARLSGLGARWRKARDTVRAYFRVEGDRLVDPELLAHRAEREQFHNERSEAGRKGAAVRRSTATGSASSKPEAEPHAELVAKPLANAQQNSSKTLALQSASASASASKSGAEADVSSRPAVADAVSGANGAAPPAPPADAGAAEDQERKAPLPTSALLLVHRMPDPKSEDGRRQLRDTLTSQGARLKAGEYVRAYNAAHLEWACNAVLDSPPDKPEQLARWVLLKLRDTFAEWRSRDDRHAEQKTAPTIAKLVHNAEPIDELGEAHRWVFANPDVKAEIEAAAEERFAGFPKNAGMLRKHMQWIDEQTLARWKAATAEPARP